MVNKIECSAVVEEKKLNVVPKIIFVYDCYFDFGLKWRLQKTNWENIYHEATEIRMKRVSCCFRKSLLFAVKQVSLFIYVQMVGN